MGKLENLLSQQKDLQAQIFDLKTADIRDEIENLKAQERQLLQQIADAKIVNKASDVEIADRIAELKAQITQLNDLSVSNLNSRLRLENSLRLIQGELTRKQFELQDLLN